MTLANAKNKCGYGLGLIFISNLCYDQVLSKLISSCTDITKALALTKHNYRHLHAMFIYAS